VPAGKAYDSEVAMLRADLPKPAEMVTLDRFERDHARVIGSYRVPKKQKNRCLTTVGCSALGSPLPRPFSLKVKITVLGFARSFE
jgi:hypothetical protein